MRAWISRAVVLCCNNYWILPMFRGICLAHTSYSINKPRSYKEMKYTNTQTHTKHTQNTHKHTQNTHKTHTKHTQNTHKTHTKHTQNTHTHIDIH